MKRIPAMMLALLLVLSGCAGGSIPVPDAPDAPSVAEPGSPDGPTDTDETPPPEPVDLETVAIAGAPGFYDLLKLPALADLKITAMTLEDEDHLILISGDRAEEVSRFSLETGVLEPICTLPIQNQSDWVSASIASVDPLVIYEYDEGNNYYIDSENQYHVIPQSEEDGISYWDCVYVDDVCLWHQSSSGVIWSQPLAGGEATEVGQLPQDLYYFSMQGLLPPPVPRMPACWSPSPGRREKSPACTMLPQPDTAPCWTPSAFPATTTQATTPSTTLQSATASVRSAPTFR